MSDFQYPVPNPLPPVPAPVAPIIDQLPMPDVPVPAMPQLPAPSAEAIATAHSDMMDADATARGATGIGPNGPYADASLEGRMQPAPGVVLEGSAAAGTSTDPHARLQLTLGNPAGDHARAAMGVDQNGMYANGGINVTDDQLRLQGEAALRNQNGQPTGDARFDLNAVPIPGSNLGIHMAAQNIGREDMKAYASANGKFPLGQNGSLQFGAGVDQNGNPQLDAEVQARLNEQMRLQANASVMDRNNDGVPDYEVNAGIHGEF